MSASVGKSNVELDPVVMSCSVSTTVSVFRRYIVTCVDCDKPRVLYSGTKLNNQEKNLLRRLLELYSYTCGAILQDLKTLDNRTPRVNALLAKVFVRQNITFRNEVEVPYSSA